MPQRTELQFYVTVESFLPPDLENTKDNIQIRPVSGGHYPPTTRIECSRGLSNDHPLGTKFRITVEEADDQNGLGIYLRAPGHFCYEVV